MPCYHFSLSYSNLFHNLFKWLPEWYFQLSLLPPPVNSLNLEWSLKNITSFSCWKQSSGLSSHWNWDISVSHDLTPIWAYLLPSSFYLHYSKYPGLLSVPHKLILYLGPLHLTFLFLKYLHGWLPHFFQASAHLLPFREIFPTVFSNVSQLPSQPLIFSPPPPSFL